ncbi:unnamed protein product [Owenia fusiformis]|uniref:Cyclic nucleotide-binding domain-containing protein n=1 Tax=Owenia fusiformis TaxID=6347 RepID=A0A8S4MUC4_OWEFU|nr:unnamed protein product [Owenia fusiformis]
MFEKIIDLIIKKPENRSSSQIADVLPWLRKKSNILKDLHPDVLSVIIKKCQHKHASPDDVIIQQGETGDCFYIIVSGTVSVYIDSKIEDDLGIVDVLDNDGDDHKPVIKSRRKRKRNEYGKFIVHFGTGDSFGELALISTDEIDERNATVIADEDADFLVIDKTLYEGTLKAFQQREFQEKREFVETHPIFSRWSIKLRKQLEMSLTKESFLYDNCINKQGQPFSGVRFLFRGHAELLFDASQHEIQYPYILEDAIKQEEELAEGIHFVDKTKTVGAVLATRRPPEKPMSQKYVGLCSVEPGEIMGDVELVCGLNTHFQTAVCLSQVETYVLNPENADRLLNRKDYGIGEVIRLLVESKLMTRISSLRERNLSCPLMNRLLFTMTYVPRPPSSQLPPFKMSKDMPSKDLLDRYLIKSFKEGRTTLVDPVNPDSIYLLEQMREKARERTQLMQRKVERGEVTKIFIEREKLKERKKILDRKPRSRRELSDVLKKQFTTEKAAESEVAKRLMGAINGASNVWRKKYVPTRPSLNTYATTTHTKPMENDELETTTGTPVEGGTSNANIPSTGREEAFWINEQKVETSETREKHVRFRDSDAQPSESNPAQLKMSRSDMSKNSKQNERQASILKSSQIQPESTKTKESVGGAVVKCEVKKATTEKIKGIHSHSTEQRDQRITDVLDRSKGRRKRDALTFGDHRPGDKWRRIKMKFISAYVTYRTSMGDSYPDFKDWETSDKTLSYLEKRLQNFHINVTPKLDGDQKVESPQKHLHRLKRYTVQDGGCNPKGGSMVLLKKKPCEFAHSKYLIKHPHVKYNIVDELPNRRQLQKTKYFMTLFMDNAMKKLDARLDQQNCHKNKFVDFTSIHTVTCMHIYRVLVVVYKFGDLV